MSFLEHIQEAYSALHGMLYAQLVEPLLFAMGKMAWAEDVFDGTEWFLLGCIQLLIISVIFRTWILSWNIFHTLCRNLFSDLIPLARYSF